MAVHLPGKVEVLDTSGSLAVLFYKGDGLQAAYIFRASFSARSVV